MTRHKQDQLQSLPAIGQLLNHPQVADWVKHHPRSVVVHCLQRAVRQVREQILSGQTNGKCSDEMLLAVAGQHLDRATTSSLRRVINATGVVLHTGLGRAPLSEDAIRAVVDVAAGYSNLELDLESGSRGRRTSHVAALLTELTGAEAATVVNNNAAATLLVLNTIAAGREVVVSRGELVEIGGSFRLPDVMAASGAKLHEVGTTNRTRIGDYERAIGDETAALLRVHSSNYRIIGFTASASIEELVALGRRTNLTVVDDLGSGLLYEPKGLALADEPTVRAAVAAGSDLVCFSGDKLLGGPQAGIILGRADLIERIDKNPLMRTYRVDKMTLAAMEATLAAYRDESTATRSIPALAMLGADKQRLSERGAALCELLTGSCPNERFEVIDDTSVAGGGSLPAVEFETCCVRWTPANTSVDQVLTALREGRPPVVARANNDAILFDMRTVFDHELPILATAVAIATGGSATA